MSDHTNLVPQVFFNAALWVLIPLYILKEAYGRICDGLKLKAQTERGKKRS
jgi:hypothetical protein